MAKKNPYAVLRVLPTASHADIRRAYISRLEIVRPERFDAKTQPEEWKRTTEMVTSTGYSGHIIQLIRQVSGNLPTTQIGPRDW